MYSGGGIEPDHRMAGPIEGFNPGKFARRLYPAMFANYAQRFDREGDNRFGTATDSRRAGLSRATSSSTMRWWRISRPTSGRR